MEIGLSNLRQLEIKFAGQLSHVPKHIAQLQLQGFTDLS